MATVTVTPGYNWVSGEVVTPAKMNLAAAPTVAAVLADGEITTNKLAPAAVTNAKLAADLDASKLTTGTLPIARIADDAITNDKLSLSANAGEIKKALNADNEPPIFACRAWVNFDGTAGDTIGGEFRCTIRASGNVSKVVRTATGTFVVHFSTAMPDNDYCVFAMPNEVALGNRSAGINIRGTDDSLMSTTSVTLDTGSASSGGAGNISVNNIAIFR
jgi:hypothetical protein